MRIQRQRGLGVSRFCVVGIGAVCPVTTRLPIAAIAVTGAFFTGRRLIALVGVTHSLRAIGGHILTLRRGLIDVGLCG